MEIRKRIITAIYRAVDELNESLPNNRRLDKASTTALFGESSTLDSLGLVNLIVAVEQEVLDEVGAAITLADEKAMSQTNSPFRTIDSLADYITSLV